MEKTKLAICIEDEEYKERFVKCVMNHYKESFEIHVIDNMNGVTVNQSEEFGVIIADDDKEIEEKEIDKFMFLVLREKEAQEKNSLIENVHYTSKFQEVYKIIEEVEKILVKKSNVGNKRIKKGKMQLIGVFSLGKEVLQIPFVGLLAEILGENSRVLVMDIQPFSGLAMEIEIEDVLGMEDMLTIATIQNYTANRLAGSIGHEQKWDFIYPVKNSSCLSEAGADLYQNMLDILRMERHYDYIIINFGAVFSGMMELMDSCRQIYLLTEKQEERNWREASFLAEMNNHGKRELLRKITWIEMPIQFMREKSWKQLSKSWLWSELGDQLRELYWVETENGTSK